MTLEISIYLCQDHPLKELQNKRLFRHWSIVFNLVNAQIVLFQQRDHDRTLHARWEDGGVEGQVEHRRQYVGELLQ